MFSKKEKTEEMHIDKSDRKERVLDGIVVSDKMNKTRVVAISRRKQNTKYKKYFASTKRYKAHDEQNEYHTGDAVRIRQIRPMSKDKRWEIIERLKGGVEHPKQAEVENL